ncbi:hypothetical protein B4086_5489 [Bacillus cereus]|nr:hypothetical protein B4086_5489 [Bacillus cereus]
MFSGGLGTGSVRKGETGMVVQSDLQVIEEIKTKLNLPLSEEQEAVILHKDAPLNVLACAGSGKTTVLLGRLIKREMADGVRPQNMLAITFLKSAKEDMEKRYRRFRKKMGLKGYGKATFKTFHGLFYMLLTSIPKYKKVTVASEGNYKYGLMRVIRGDGDRDKDAIYEEMMSYRSKLINKGLSPNGIDNVPANDDVAFSIENYKEVMEAYREFKERDGVIDFDDMQVLLLQALEQNNADTMVRNFRSVFLDVYIDEYQDISPVQVEIIDYLIGDRTGGLVAVGDADQSIYSFRGSNPKYILDFLYRYIGAKRLMLSTNYRCSANILEPVIPSIQRNKGRVDVPMKAFKQGGEVIGVPMEDGYRGISSLIRDDVEESLHADYERTVAILVRQNSQRMLVADALVEEGIPVDIVHGRWSLRNNKVYKLIMDIVDMVKKEDGELFSIHANKFCRHIHSDVSKLYKTDVRQNWFEDVVVYDIHQTPQETRKILESIKESNNMGNCVGFAWKLVSEYYQRLDARGFTSYKKVLSIVKYIHSLARGKTLTDFYEKEKRKERLLQVNIGVKLLEINTLHSVKGLEYDVVYMVGLDDALFPMIMDEDEAEEQMEEERRLFYVGSTRAKERLVYAYDVENPTSFLRELEIDLPRLQRFKNISES